MLPVSPEVLSLSSDAVLLVRGGRVAYANPRAEALLGRALAGLKSSELFGEDILGSQADSFAADALVCGRYCSLRTLRIADARVYYLQSPELTADYVSDAFICSARGLLMNMRLSIDLLRRSAESGDSALSEPLCALLRGYFGVSRMLENASVLQNCVHGTEELRAEPICLSSLCREICSTLRLLRRDVSFVFSSEEEAWIDGDRAMIEQLVYNLVSNALVHGKGLSRVSLRVVCAENLVLLSVGDDGCGMDDAALSRAFERYRSPYELSQLGSGAGLGLSAVRAVARQHGGTLMLESRPGSGTSARVSLRRLRPSDGVLKQSEPFEPGMQRLLTGLCLCLPGECFGECFMD